MIPKIIHQFAPADTNKWHTIWKSCQKTWLSNFNNFEYKLWNDEEINSFVKEKYPSLSTKFLYCSSHIVQLDIARLLVLYYYGGIYADMDMYCYKNFYNNLTGTSLVSSAPILTEQSGEVLTNCMMVSNKKDNFFAFCIQEAFTLLEDETNNKILLTGKGKLYDDVVKKIAGPYFIYNTYEKYPWKSNITLLEYEKYNPAVNTKTTDEVLTRHMLTGVWGGTDIESILSKTPEFFGLKNKLTNEEKFNLVYKGKRGIDITDPRFKQFFNIEIN